MPNEESESRRRFAEEIAPVIGAIHPGVSRVILYGSVARNEANSNSDTDLCVVLAEDETTRPIQHGYILEEITNELTQRGYSVGMDRSQVHLERASEAYFSSSWSFPIDRLFLESIIEEGIALYSRSNPNTGDT